MTKILFKPSSVKKLQRSSDGTIKLFFEGYHAVLIPQKQGKNTLCISSQVGCAMGCTFCYTAKMGFVRNLRVEEILLQVRAALEVLNAKDVHTKDSPRTHYAHDVITSLVFMGMGEPLNNWENVQKAMHELNEDYSYPYKKITISTSGVLPKMKEFLEFPFKPQLALSLHSPFQEIRDVLMPLCKQWRVEDIVSFCNDYAKKRKESVMIEYVMIKGLTDRDEDVKALLSLGFTAPTNFNLIPLNGELQLRDTAYIRSDSQRMTQFAQALRVAGHKAFIRHTRGSDIDAACGMLEWSDCKSNL
jgi:23S rRNA (adenine2503-C2)-methyltransferase